VSYKVVWEAEALTAAQRFAADDHGGVSAVFDRADRLAQNPRPVEATVWGGPNWRLRCGAYRLLYEADETTVTVSVLHLGQSLGGVGK
jgi:mRNA-degrading endonuclease RelE of RelBE toxin-antitoxin system